ncbi:MAG: ribbon-helix-helix protein, CopG family [Thermoguttaceae bacterium]|nr:ribbon-helix-helix protein, CopG family [Thermoguttaceae bacterium]
MIPEELEKRVEKVAKEKGVSKSAFINEAIKDALKDERLSVLEARVSELEKEVAELKNKCK